MEWNAGRGRRRRSLLFVVAHLAHHLGRGHPDNVGDPAGGYAVRKVSGLRPVTEAAAHNPPVRRREGLEPILPCPEKKRAIAARLSELRQGGLLGFGYFGGSANLLFIANESSRQRWASTKDVFLSVFAGRRDRIVD